MDFKGLCHENISFLFQKEMGSCRSSLLSIIFNYEAVGLSSWALTISLGLYDVIIINSEYVDFKGLSHLIIFL